MTEEKWYLIKGPSEKRWYAYKVKPEMIKHLKDGYEWHGPYKSMVAAIMAANDDDLLEAKAPEDRR